MSTHSNNHNDRPSAKRRRITTLPGAEVIAEDADDDDDEEESFLLSSSFQSQSQSQSQGWQSQGLDLTQNSQESDRTVTPRRGRVSPTHPAPMYRLPVPPSSSSMHAEEPGRSSPPPPPPFSSSCADDTTETVASVVQKLNAITRKNNNSNSNDQRVAAAAAAAIVPPNQHATILRLLKLLRRWSETASKRTRTTTNTSSGTDNKNTTNFFQQFQLPDVQGMACVTQLLDYLVRTHITTQTPPWESLKYVGRIVTHCTTNGPEGQHRTTAATLATEFIAQGGLSTVFALAFGGMDEDEDGYTNTIDGTTTPAAIATATATATVLTDKFRAILYIWGGLMNVLSHKRVVETNVLDAKVSIRVYQCGMQTIRWVRRHKNRDTTAEYPYDAILKNVFGTLSNVLQFQTSRAILAKISDYATTGTRNDRTLLSIIFNEALRTKRTTPNAEPTAESDEEASHDDDEDDDFRSTSYNWDYNVHTWKKAAFLLYLCYVKTHPPILPLVEEVRQHRSCRDDVAQVSAFCVEFMRHDPNEAYRSNAFALLHTFIAFSSSPHQGEHDAPPHRPRDAHPQHDAPPPPQNRIRNTHDLMITLGTILDSRPNSFGHKYSIDPRTKEAARKVLRSLL